MQLHLKKCVKNIFLKFQISSDCLWIPDCTNMGTILYILLCYHHDTIIKTILYVMETSLTLFCSDQLQLLLWLLCLLMLLPFHASMHRFFIFLIPVFSFPLPLGHFSNFSSLVEAVSDTCYFDPGGFA